MFDLLETNRAAHTPKRAAKQLADDKYKTFCFFDRLGIKQPKTLQFDICISTSGTIFVDSYPTSGKTGGTSLYRQFELIKKQLGLPFIAKPRFGSMGRNIALIENAEQLQTALKNDNHIIFQEFIETKSDFQNRSDLRFFVIDGRVEACVLRIAHDGKSIASNAHQGGLMKKYSASKDFKELAISVIDHAGLDYGTADFLLSSADQGKPLLCEINACPGFEAMEKELNLDIAGRIVNLALNLQR